MGALGVVHANGDFDLALTIRTFAIADGRIGAEVVPVLLPARYDAAAVEARIREATGHVPLERLALSPQCGFNSASQGNRLSGEEQTAKLRRVVEVARDVWGRAASN